ncbi:MAG: STAS domain-containing protein [Clostridia bacterium]|nr:STAS domain-containing protein [Clostridia bacterium]
MEEVKVLGIQDGVLKIELLGEIDLGNADAFYQAVISAYRETPANLYFDCTELAFIDSTTLGTFVKILKTVKADGRKLTLANLQAKIKKLFVICALDSIMELV